MKLLFTVFTFLTISSAAQAYDSYYQSCRVRYEDAYVIQADCRTVNGNYIYNNFDRSNCQPGTISNQNGWLQCIYYSNGGGGGGGNYGQLPWGSYSQSCQSCYMSGSTLQCQCLTVNNSWRSTSLNMRNCPRYSAGNQNGRLVCE